MNYKELQTQILKVPSRGSLDFDAGDNSIILPKEGDKIFLHWMTDSGKLRATYSLRMPVSVTGKLKIVNGSNEESRVQIVKP